MPADLSPLWISLKVALLGTGLTFFAGIAAAYWMRGYRGKGRALIEGIFVSPLILPPTVVGFLLLLLFGRNGPIGQLTRSLGFSVVFTWYGGVITALVVSFPLMYRTVLGAFEQIDGNLLGVARTLGASEWRVFWRILLPLAFPGILAGTTLAFARALGEFGATLMLAGNIPGQTQTIPMAIYFAVEAGAPHEAWFWSLVIMGLSLSGIFLTNLWQEGRDRHQSHSGQSPIGTSPSQPWTLQAADPVLPGSSIGLHVEVAKAFASFRLQASFNTAGATLGLLGSSGSGKSVILKCIAGIETPSEGRIVLNGRVLFDSKQKINLPSRDRRIGFLVQNYALFPHMTVAQNIAFGLPRGLSKQGIRQRVEAQLVTVQLPGLGDRYPHQLSGGQQQRVALARALASHPEALLLDEPFSALDTHLRSQIEQELVTQLETYAGTTLFVTHNLEEAYRVCQDLLVLEQGRPIAAGSKQDIFEHPGTYGVAQLTGCKNFSQAIPVAVNQIEAVDWGVRLQLLEPLTSPPDFVGIRAHQLMFVEDTQQENTFPCWLVKTSETPHRMTLFLKLNHPAQHHQDYHLQAEVFKEKWYTLKDHPFPWSLRLDPLRLLLLQK
ncbi:molybdenum ABC transporter permease subunit [Leptolyngbya sp. 'hensonii']|uniref:molybdate ABC transporter permease subunit n=1 Tax=Leptolyngbya sp. 'hensonii' TaxID=1922337 RepID=UPI00095019B5|nr:molybdate ABC transporter permease subunit [Leptolyngbya sp. 'hensonii']OLP16341.1 molybdenum ABC transporter permease subunit [Leptolyngbya sp. 'hensonii']